MSTIPRYEYKQLSNIGNDLEHFDVDTMKATQAGQQSNIFKTKKTPEEQNAAADAEINNACKFQMNEEMYGKLRDGLRSVRDSQVSAYTGDKTKALEEKKRKVIQEYNAAIGVLNEFAKLNDFNQVIATNEIKDTDIDHIADSIDQSKLNIITDKIQNVKVAIKKLSTKLSSYDDGLVNKLTKGGVFAATEKALAEYKNTKITEDKYMEFDLSSLDITGKLITSSGMGILKAKTHSGEPAKILSVNAKTKVYVVQSTGSLTNPKVSVPQKNLCLVADEKLL